MKTVTKIAILLPLASLLVSACGNSSGVPTSLEPTESTSPVFAEPSPSYDDLVRDGFADPSIPRMTAEELKLKLDSGEKMIIIDNRNDYKFKTGHIAGAIHIEDAIGVPGLEDTMDKALTSLPDDTLKVLYCD